MLAMGEATISLRWNCVCVRVRVRAWLVFFPSNSTLGGDGDGDGEMLHGGGILDASSLEKMKQLKRKTRPRVLHRGSDAWALLSVRP